MKTILNLKSAKMLAICLTVLLVAGCARDPRELDGQLVKDAKGNIYQLEATIGDNYFLRPIGELGSNLDEIRGN